jgi:hypothetical protein
VARPTVSGCGFLFQRAQAGNRGEPGNRGREPGTDGRFSNKRLGPESSQPDPEEIGDRRDVF